jgi:hypothetical protein
MSDTAYTAPGADNSPTTPARNMRHIALEHARNGWQVFPLVAGGKVPLPGSGGHLDATRDPEQIKRWWSDVLTGGALDHNVGIRPNDHCVIVDLDEKQNRQGVAHYLELGGTLDGLCVRTASGGYHLYCKAPEAVKCSESVLGQGIDTKGPRGYVVAPGSRVGDVAYEVVGGGPLLPHLMQPIPAFVVAGVGTDREADEKKSTQTFSWVFIEDDRPENITRAVEHVKRAAPAASGEWHPAGFRLGADLCRIGLSAETTVEVLAEHWMPRGTGFTSREQFVRDVTGGYETARRDGQHGTEGAGDPREAFLGVVLPLPPQPIGDKAPRYTKLRKLSVADCIKAPARQYIIKDILAAGDVACVVGMPGAGKSTVTPLIGYLLALGLPVFGKRTRPGKVLYAPCEDVHGFNGRVHALKLRHGDCDNFAVVHGVNDLLNDPVQAREFIAMVHEDKPALVVIDTLAAAWPGLKENETDSMDHVVTLARKLATPAAGPPTTAVVIIHHPVKTGGIMPRGAGNLNGALDVVLGLEKDGKTGVVVVSFGKNRNGPTDETFAFRFESQIIGQDEDGERLTAGIAVMADPAECKRAQPLTASETQVVEIMRDLIDKGEAGTTGGRTFTDYGVDLTGKVGVGRQELKEACEARGLSPAKTKRDRTQKFNRCMEGLTTKGVVKLLHDIVFIDKDDLE